MVKSAVLLVPGREDAEPVPPFYQPGIVDKLFEPLGVRDVFGQSTTTASQVRYVVEGTALSGAAGVAEAGTKPESTIAMSEVVEPVNAAEQRKANRSRFDGFYCSKAWRLARRRQLWAYPLCQFVEGGEECGLLADSVHHIVELEDGGRPATRPTSCRAAGRTTP